MKMEKIHINPKNIQRGIFLFKPSRVTLITDGDWDKDAFLLKVMPKNKALYAHFVEGIPWEDTGIIDEVLYLRQVKARDKIRKPPTRDEVIKRYKQLDNIMTSIRNNGWDYSKGGHIYIAIGRNNEVFFAGNGWHRLWICQYLNVNTIPAKVIVRHPLSTHQSNSEQTIASQKNLSFLKKIFRLF